MPVKRPIDDGQITGNTTAEIFMEPSQEPAAQGRTRRLITRDDGDGTGTVSLQYSPNGESGSYQEQASVTLGTDVNFEAPPGLHWQIVVSGGTSPDMYYWIF